MPSRHDGPGGGALGIVAGTGDLPRRIAEAQAARALPYLVIAFAALPWAEGHPFERHRFEKAGRVFAALERAGCDRVVFAGAMDRPRLAPWAFDLTAWTIAARVLWLLRQGDDAMLRGLGGLFEHRGFRLVGADECLPGLGVAAGVLGRHRPSARDRADAARGGAILAALGPLDVSQAAAVAGGVCLGIEAVEGTDALLARVAALPAAKRAAAPGGVLVKRSKSGQDARLDRPTVGPATVEGAARAGLGGIALEEGTLVLDRAATVAAADAHGLFLWAATGVELGDPRCSST